jgi:hypothetical protein
MSSRSLAAARAKRAGDNAPLISGTRPGTSIGSQAAFAAQGQYQNVRGGKNYSQPQQLNAYQQVKQSQNQSKNSLPFSKLSISDAIGLITLRLGRVEQWVIETENESENKSEGISLPENTKLIDNSIFSSIINRIENVEKIKNEPINNDYVSKLSEDVVKFTEQLTKVEDQMNKHTLSISKHTEQLFKVERDLTETKDILKTFMMKYDLFTEETNNKFTDYETALSELEKNIFTKNNEENVVDGEQENGEVNSEVNGEVNGEAEETNTIMSVDLKNIIKNVNVNATYDEK